MEHSLRKKACERETEQKSYARPPPHPKFLRGRRERRDQDIFKTLRLADSILLAYHDRAVPSLSTNEDASGDAAQVTSPPCT